MTYVQTIRPAMTKDKKFQHQCILVKNLAYSKETEIWCLTYIDFKRNVFQFMLFNKHNGIKLMHPKFATANQVFDIEQNCKRSF